MFFCESMLTEECFVVSTTAGTASSDVGTACGLKNDAERIPQYHNMRP